MDMDPAERGEVEWVSEFCPMKGFTRDREAAFDVTIIIIIYYLSAIFLVFCTI